MSSRPRRAKSTRLYDAGRDRDVHRSLRSAARPRPPTASPSSENVTIAPCSRPTSCTVTPAIAGEPLAQRRRRAPTTRSRIASRPQPERVVDRDAEADLRGVRCAPSSRSGGRRARIPYVPSSSTRRRAGRAAAARGARSASRRTYRKPVPRGPRRNLRPVALRDVAADLADVDRHLADRLAGVEQEAGCRPRG